MNKNDEAEKMKPYKVNFPPSLWIAGRQKVGLKSFAAVIRELVELWLADSISLPSEKEK